MKAPKGFSLKDLKPLIDFDPHYGGRWNAGANTRGGNSTTLEPQKYVELLNDRTEALLQTLNSSDGTESEA